MMVKESNGDSVTLTDWRPVKTTVSGTTVSGRWVNAFGRMMNLNALMRCRAVWDVMGSHPFTYVQATSINTALYIRLNYNGTEAQVISVKHPESPTYVDAYPKRFRVVAYRPADSLVDAAFWDLEMRDPHEIARNAFDSVLTNDETDDENYATIERAIAALTVGEMWRMSIPEQDTDDCRVGLVFRLA